MSAINIYLHNYYKTSGQLAKACSISSEELSDLVNENLVPKPSYFVIKDGRLVSQVFGEFSCPELMPEHYFHPGNSTWVQFAIDTKIRLGVVQGRIELEQNFKREFASSLGSLNKTHLPLTDCFSAKGGIIQEGIDIRTDQAWRHFLNGIFGLCVADPSTIESIARKEILQEAITVISDNGAKLDFTQAGKESLLELIDQYDTATMPFSPLEYQFSSRKRLVEDLKKKLAA